LSQRQTFFVLQRGVPLGECHDLSINRAAAAAAAHTTVRIQRRVALSRSIHVCGSGDAQFVFPPLQATFLTPNQASSNMQPHTGKRKRAPPRSQGDTSAAATWNQILKNGQPPKPSELPAQLMNQNRPQAALFQPSDPAAVRSIPAQRRVATPVFLGRPRPKTPPFPFAACTVGLDPARLPSEPDPIAVAEINRVIPEPPRRANGKKNLAAMVKLLETDGMGSYDVPPARKKRELDKQHVQQTDTGARQDQPELAEDMSGADFDALFQNLADSGLVDLRSADTHSAGD